MIIYILSDPLRWEVVADGVAVQIQKNCILTYYDQKKHTKSNRDIRVVPITKLLTFDLTPVRYEITCLNIDHEMNTSHLDKLNFKIMT